MAIDYKKRKKTQGSITTNIRSIDKEIDILDNTKEEDEDKRNEDLDLFIDD